ncbi:hypothetical protein V8V88_26930 [Paenibacillus phytohabitans]
MAREFTNRIISFHAADMQDRVIIEKSELNRMKEFISGEVVGQAEGHRQRPDNPSAGGAVSVSY